MNLHEVAHTLNAALLDSPVAEKAMEKATLASGGVSTAAGVVTYFGMTETEWTLVFAAGGLFFTVVFGCIHVWIKFQHLKIAQGKDVSGI